MIIYSRKQNHKFETKPSILVLQIGLGLIGQSVCMALLKNGFTIENRYNINWSYIDDLNLKLKLAKEQISKVDRLSSIHVVWTAGKGGFSSPAEEFKSEQIAFGKVIQFTSELDSSFQDTQVKIHVLSSAGGLFEGQTLVDNSSTPEPKRPYGLIKMQQENTVLSLSEKIHKQIYRPSSVYGYYGEGYRKGLIVTLIQRALQGVPIELYGRSDTLRDYVYLEDIGHYIAKCITQNATLEQINFLTSGKPTSTFEVLNLVQGYISKPIYIRYIAEKRNDNNITYRKSSAPALWRSTPNTVGIKKTISKVQAKMIENR